MPRPFFEYMERVRNLGWESNPDYDGYIRLFEHHMLERGMDPEEVDFDWVKKDTDWMLKDIIAKLEQKMREKNINF